MKVGLLPLDSEDHPWKMSRTTPATRATPGDRLTPNQQLCLRGDTQPWCTARHETFPFHSDNISLSALTKHQDLSKHSPKQSVPDTLCRTVQQKPYSVQSDYYTRGATASTRADYTLEGHTL